MSRQVLIAEDSPELRTLVNITLSSDGFDVIECGTAPEAVDIARQALPRLILMDIDMPGAYDGIEATKKLTADPTTDFTIIMLTGSKNHAEQSLQAGAVAYLTKPFSPIELLKCVAHHAGDKE